MISDKPKEYYFTLSSIYRGWISVIIITALVVFCCYMIFYILIDSKDLDLNPRLLPLVIFLSLLVLITFSMIEDIKFRYKFTSFYNKKIPAIILTHDELIDNLNNKRIAWSEINEIRIVTIHARISSYDVIGIILKDSKNFITTFKNPYIWFKAKLMQKRYGTSYLIDTDSLECSNQNLFEDLNQYFDNERA